MYAIIRTGGKQYKVQAGDVLRVEKLDQKLGSEVELSEVLFVGGDKSFVGAPLVSGAKVVAVVTQHDKDKKILVFKKKRRKGYRNLKGHRQPFTELFIQAITSPEGQTVKADNKPQIVDHQKNAEKKAELAQKHGSKAKKATVAKKKAAPTKKVAKKAAGKKKAVKKTAKKKVAKKASKKAAKK